MRMNSCWWKADEISVYASSITIYQYVLRGPLREECLIKFYLHIEEGWRTVGVLE